MSPGQFFCEKNTMNNRRTSKRYLSSKTAVVSTTYSIDLPPVVYQLFSSFSSLFTRPATIAKTKSNILGGHFMKKKKIIFIGILVLVIGFILVRAVSTLTKAAAPTTDNRAAIKGPRATLPLNKEFAFPLKDAKGKELTKIKYTIENAELRDEIIVKGSRATAIKGRTFLTLSIKLVNDYDKAIELNTRDYIRLIVAGKDQEQMAADIHNDPVTIQAISTKTTRLGFPVNDADKNLVLIIGEIKGEKQRVELNF